MIEREELFDYIEDKYKVKPDQPWDTFENYAALRHKDNEKWFALVMDITPDKIGLKGDKKIDVLNLKVRNEFIGMLRKIEGIYQAYLMDKDNWVTINLREMDSMGDIEDLIEESFDLTK